MTPAQASDHDDPILRDILEKVAGGTAESGGWQSVNELALDYPASQIDAALRMLVDRGWLSAAPMSLHSVALTPAGRAALGKQDGASRPTG
jgi:hypothetical protein